MTDKHVNNTILTQSLPRATSLLLVLLSGCVGPSSVPLTWRGGVGERTVAAPAADVGDVGGRTMAAVFFSAGSEVSGEEMDPGVEQGIGFTRKVFPRLEVGRLRSLPHFASAGIRRGETKSRTGKIVLGQHSKEGLLLDQRGRSEGLTVA